jgi:hypothetical protein
LAQSPKDNQSLWTNCLKLGAVLEGQLLIGSEWKFEDGLDFTAGLLTFDAL